MKSIKPPRLKSGDIVGICSPSGTIDHKRELFERARKNIEKQLGVRTLVVTNTYNKHYYSAGTPEERAADFHELISNPTVKAIVFSAGGDTALDLLPILDCKLIENNPKIITGISDATTILSTITATTGLITFLGTEFLDFADKDMPYTCASIQHLLFDGEKGEIYPNPTWKEFDGIPTEYSNWNTIRKGSAEGVFVGGNIQSFLQLVSTEYEFQAPNQILFFEAYKLPKKQIHKALMQIKFRGMFENTAGLVVGYNLESDNEGVVGNEQPIAETILGVVGEYDFPIMQIGEIGHHVENFIQPIGAKVRMDATNLKFEILESVVE